MPPKKLSLPDAASPLARQAALARIARSKHTLLTTGESGVGKSRLARQMHEAGPRAGGSFVSLSCAAFPRDLLGSELFGHERGAFFGAVAQKPGRVELAHGGRLFLDEIGDMPVDLQPKLLTFLPERSFYRVGGRELLTVDVRLIAATNRDLAAMVAAKTFREDLFFRIGVLLAHLPPLRERRHDIPELARGFLRAALSEMDESRDLALTPEALDLLLEYDWPDNIRELKHAMFRAATLGGDNDLITPELLLPAIRQLSNPAAAAAPTTASFSTSGTHEVLPPAEVEKREIQNALAALGTNKSRLASALGVSEKTVCHLLRRYGLAEATVRRAKRRRVAVKPLPGDPALVFPGGRTIHRHDVLRKTSVAGFKWDEFERETHGFPRVTQATSRALHFVLRVPV